ncbi:MAG: PKD domain-containing protein [Bacteroidales bacterium]
MGRIIALIPAIIFLTLSLLSGQENITGWEYWIDNGYDNRVSYTDPGNYLTDIEQGIDLGHLDDGLHVLHFRVRDENHIWSAPLLKIFTKSTRLGVTPVLSDAEVQFNNSGSVIKIAGEGSGNILTFDDNVATAETDPGIQRVSVRVRDNLGRWSVTSSSLFIKRILPPDSETLATLQYWYDDDLVNAVTFTVNEGNALIPDEEIPAALAPGLHKVSIRAMDGAGRWSSARSALFNRTYGSGEADIVMYQYWVDDNAGGTITEQITIPEGVVDIETAIDMSGYTVGEHHLNIRFLDSKGRWSVAVADTLDRISFLKALFSSDITAGCEALEVSFVSNSTDASGVKWYFGDNSTSTEENPVHTYEEAGDYTVSLVAYDEHAMLQDSVSAEDPVTVYPLPMADLGEDITGIEAGNEIVLDPGSFNSYLWIDNSTGPTLTVNSGGEYWVTVENEWGCSDSDTVIVSFATGIGSSGIMEKARIWPNPLRDSRLYIELPALFADETELTISDMNGRIVLSLLLEQRGGETISADIPGIGPGTYILTLRNGKIYGRATLLKVR